MKELNLSQYTTSILADHSQSTLPFYQSAEQSFSYQDLLEHVAGTVEKFNTLPDTFLALKFLSSYELFVHILAANFSRKEIVILAHNEPDHSISTIQKRVAFTKILSDGPLVKVSSLPKTDIDPDREAFNILSSGSSAPSKAIALTLNNVFYSAQAIIDFFRMSHADKTFLNLPHHHIGGLMILWRAFFSKSSVTTIEADSYQFISLVPLQLERALQDKNKIDQLQKCRGVLIGGAPLRPELKKEAIQHHIPVFETYGMSETSSLVLLDGRPIGEQTVKLDDNHYFLIKGKTLSPKAPRDLDGFYHTKDIGVKNPDGTFSFKQRGDLLFKSAGELIDPQAIEAVAKKIPGMKEAVVVPIKHAEWTNAATLIYKGEMSAQEIKDQLKLELHPHLIPRFIRKAPGFLIQDGIKPKRFQLSHWAQAEYFRELFHFNFNSAAHAKKFIVFLHGFMEDLEDMQPLKADLKEVNTLTVDLPGHGKTKISSFKNRSMIFLELKNLIEFYQDDLPLTLYGYSMGGRIAIELLLSGLDVDTLILESASFGLITSAEKEKRLEADLTLFQNNAQPLAAFFEKWYQNPIFASYNQHPSFKQEVERKLSHDSDEWQKSLTYFSPGASPYLYDDVIKKLNQQKIIGLYGTLDQKYSEHFLNTQLAHLKLIEIKNAGHNPHKTHLDELKRILNEIV